MNALAQDLTTGVSLGSLPAALQVGGWAVALVLLPAFVVLWRRLTSIEDARVAEMTARAKLEERLDRRVERKSTFAHPPVRRLFR